MSFVSSFLGLNHLSKESRSLVKKYVMLNTLSTIAVSLSSTFFYLFTIDALGFLNASVIFALRVFVQFVVDYPSGSLGDWIGQKRVLVLSYISYFFTFSLLFIAQTYLHFILIAIFMGIALAQESGALGSWLDNNYKKIEDQSLDPDRRNYGFTQSRLYTLLVFTLGIVVPVGGFLSELITRRLVFLLQSILTLGMILIFYFSVNDIKTDKGVKERQ
ncbi:MAG: MFS transporter, partial [Candidatus Hodarchaeota archaeon]